VCKSHVGQTMRTKLLAIILLGLAACKRSGPQSPERPPSPSPAVSPQAPSPTITPEESPADLKEEETASPVPLPEPRASFDVETPSEVNMDAGNSENRLVKSEVLARIDLMPRLTPEEKDKLYVQVERARGMGKIVAIPFATGKVTVGASEVASLEEKLKLPQLQKFAEDPTVVFVVLGFADKKGDEKKNLAISLQRADSVVKVLKERCSIMNVIHAVGMGSSDMFDAKDLDKNRVVEVWAVLP
jgi:outer membrane protein OmpA-like peptidoglycan-associated protein